MSEGTLKINNIRKGREMIIEMESDATEAEIAAVCACAKELRLGTQLNRGEVRTVVAVFGEKTGSIDTGRFEVLPGVDQVVRMQRPYKLASLESTSGRRSVIRVSGVEFGGNKIVMIAGPCSVEQNEEITLSCARMAKQNGASVLRGGAFKPRTSPFSFQGLGEAGLKILAKARQETGLLIVTEVMDCGDVNLVASYVDVLQVGARNMQNYRLLDAVGRAGKPVLLKRGFSATVEEWLMAADYVLQHNGTPKVILCHRGIRTFDNSTRFAFDVGVIPVLRQLTHLPVITDPSHAAGKFQYVPDYSKMAVAAGTDGLMVEIHPNPAKALSDGAQSLTFSDFSRMVDGLKGIASAVGRSM